MKPDPDNYDPDLGSPVLTEVLTRISVDNAAFRCAMLNQCATDVRFGPKVG